MVASRRRRSSTARSASSAKRGDLYAVEHDGPVARGPRAAACTSSSSTRASTTMRSPPPARWRATRAPATARSPPPSAPPRDGPLRATRRLTVAASTRDMPSLAPLQPWLGTSAVVAGACGVDLAAAAARSASLPLSGTISGDALRVDAPQWGVHLDRRPAGRARVVDGRARARRAVAQRGRRPLRRDRARSAALRARRRSRGLGHAARVAGADFPRCSTGRTCGSSSTARARSRSSTASSRLAGSVNVDRGHDRIRRARPTAGSPTTWSSRAAAAAGDARRPASATCRSRSTSTSISATRLTLHRRGARDRRWPGAVKVTTAAARRAARAGHDPRRARHVLRVRPEARHRPRPAHLRRPARQSGARHRRGAPEPRRSTRASSSAAPCACRSVSAHVESAGARRREARLGCVTGQGLDRASRADVAALQAASAALLGRGERPLTTTIAQPLGLDDISFGSGGAAGRRRRRRRRSSSFGKRLTDRLSLVYEQGLTRRDQRAAARVRAVARPDAARRSRHGQRRRHLLPPDDALTARRARAARSLRRRAELVAEERATRP